jgi:hypothetical protein
MALDVGRGRLPISFEDDDDDLLEELASNLKLADFFNKLIDDHDVREPKHPDTIYKIALDGGDGVKVDSKK